MQYLLILFKTHLSISSTKLRNLDVSSNSWESFVGSDNSEMDMEGSEDRTTLNLFLLMKFILNCRYKPLDSSPGDVFVIVLKGIR